MEKGTIKKNYFYNVLYQLLIIILPIITTPYIARTLGAEGNGIYGYTLSIVTYFILFGSFGISIYGQREIAYVQGDAKKRSSILFELCIIRLITMILSSLVFYFIFCRNGLYSIYYKILLLEMLANILDISWFYQGMEDFKKIVIRNFVIKIISVICIFIFIKKSTDLNKYIFIYSISTLIGSLTLWFGLKKYICKPGKLKFKHHIPLIISLFIPQIAIQIYTVLDKTMIGIILNDMREVGYYEQAQKIIKILLTIITAIGTVMMPRIANCYAKGDNDQIKKYMYKTFSFVFLLSFPLMFGLIAVSNNFVPLFFGKGYDKVPLIMNILSTIVLFISLSSIIGNQYLLSIKKQKEFTISVIAGSVVNFILNLILIQKYKSYGASFATLFAELSVTIIQLYFIRKEFKISKILVLSKNYLISGIIMFIFCYVIDILILNNLISLIIQIFIGLIVYPLVLYLIRDSFFIETVNKILKRKQ